jgi:hypothetical protein
LRSPVFEFHERNRIESVRSKKSLQLFCARNEINGAHCITRFTLSHPRMKKRTHCTRFPRLLRQLQTPRQSLFFSPSIRVSYFCTTHAAVTHSLLDRRKTSRSNPLSAKKFFREVFHAAKSFVLVCRLFYFLKFSFAQASAPDMREAFCTN